MIIERPTVVTDELVRALRHLAPQLTNTSPALRATDLEVLLTSPGSVLLIARHSEPGDQIIGAGALGTYQVLTGLRAVIEDVVVDREARGRGVGEAIVRALLDIARKRGAPGVSLTSNPRREAANRLYARMGFLLRETNCYYYTFP